MRSSARASFGKFYLLDAELRLPRLADDHAFVNLYAVHRNYPHIDYYGPGPDSAKTGRSVWALEDTSFECARASSRSGISASARWGVIC